MSDIDEIAQCLALLTAAFPVAKISPETVQVYATVLSDLPGNSVRAAVLDCISRCKWFPTVAEIRATAIQIMTPTIPPAGEAWGEVLKRAQGGYGRDWTPDFDNPTLMATVRAMGWRNICMSENQVADRARFIELYNEFAKRTQHDQITLPEVKALAAKLTPRISQSVPRDEFLPGPTQSDPDSWTDISEILEQERREAFRT